MPQEVKIKVYPGVKGGVVLQIHDVHKKGDYVEISMERVTASHLAMDIEEITGAFRLTP